MSKHKVTIGQVFKSIVWPRKNLILLGLFLIVISRLASLVLPWASKSLIDDVIAKGDIHQLKILLIEVTASIILQAGTSFLLTQLLSVEAQKLISVLRAQVQKQLLRLPIRFFDNNKSGALVSRVMNDVEGVRNLVGTGLVQLVGGILSSILCLVLLIRISPSMTLFVLVPVAIFGFISLKAFAKIRPIFRERGKLNAEVTGRLTETLNGVRVIKGFNAEAQEIKTFEAGVEKLFLNVKKSLTSTSLVTSAATFLLGLASTGIMGIGGYFIIHHEMTLGDFLSFTLFLGFMIAPIVQMSNIGSQLTEAFAGLDRTEELMNMAVEDDGTTRTMSIGNITGDIVFNNVSFSYEEGKTVLRNISFQSPAGSVTALVGTSGSGKTTIAGLVATFLNADSGTITVDGVDLSKISLTSYRSQLGVVLQDDFLFEGTIRENILFPRPDASLQELERAVAAAHVNEFTNRFEKGLDTVIGERGVKLSGGQRQRIAIARALISNPRILIFDEATSALDYESERIIQQNMKSICKGRTVLIIAHRLSAVRDANRIIVMEKGQFAEEGSHSALLTRDGGLYAKLHKMQQG